MTFLEHLDELRKRITHAVAALLVGFIVAFAFIDQVQAFIYQRLTADIPGGKLIFTEPGEGFFLWMKMAALTGVQEIQIFGARTYAMRVWLDPQRMAAHGLHLPHRYRRHHNHSPHKLKPCFAHQHTHCDKS